MSVHTSTGGGYPQPGLDGGRGTWGNPPPARSGWCGGGTPSTPPPIGQSSIVSTCYAAGGMPLAFTQEDFLVSSKENLFV